MSDPIREVVDAVAAAKISGRPARDSAPPPENPETRKTDGKPTSLSEKSFQEASRKAPGKLPPLALEPDILAVWRRDLERAGLAGEQQAAQVVYLALTSRVLPWGKTTNRPVSAIGKGTTGSGKSYTLEQVLRFFPKEAYVDLGSMSRRYLFYTEEEFAHRFLIVPEWSTIADDEEIVSMLRILLSAGRIIHGTVEGEGKRAARRIEKPGPTGLLMTTTRASTDEELETRCLSFLTDDSPEQTRRVFEALAGLEDEDEPPVDFDRWRDLQQWIAESGEARVAIPFVGALAQLMPTVATRLRRDFVSMLCLVRAHAVLHQATRERDSVGRIVADISDYAAVRALVGGLIAEAVDAGVSAAMRQTVSAVRALLDDTGREHVSVKALTDHLQVGKSATYDRVNRALRAGYLANLAKRDERGYKLAMGAEMPGGGAFLPAESEVFRVLSSRPTGNANQHEQTESGEFSGIPGLPAAPRERPPRLGDEMFPVFLADAVRDGHITHAEAEARYALHKKVAEAK